MASVSVRTEVKQMPSGGWHAQLRGVRGDLFVFREAETEAAVHAAMDLALHCPLAETLVQKRCLPEKHARALAAHVSELAAGATRAQTMTDAELSQVAQTLVGSPGTELEFAL